MQQPFDSKTIGRTSQEIGPPVALAASLHPLRFPPDLGCPARFESPQLPCLRDERPGAIAKSASATPLRVRQTYPRSWPSDPCRAHSFSRHSSIVLVSSNHGTLSSSPARPFRGLPMRATPGAGRPTEQHDKLFGSAEAVSLTVERLREGAVLVLDVRTNAQAGGGSAL